MPPALLSSVPATGNVVVSEPRRSALQTRPDLTSPSTPACATPSAPAGKESLPTVAPANKPKAGGFGAKLLEAKQKLPDFSTILKKQQRPGFVGAAEPSHRGRLYQAVGMSSVERCRALRAQRAANPVSLPRRAAELASWAVAEDKVTASEAVGLLVDFVLMAREKLGKPLLLVLPGAFMVSIVTLGTGKLTADVHVVAVGDELPKVAEGTVAVVAAFSPAPVGAPLTERSGACCLPSERQCQSGSVELLVPNVRLLKLRFLPADGPLDGPAGVRTVAALKAAGFPIVVAVRISAESLAATERLTGLSRERF